MTAGEPGGGDLLGGACEGIKGLERGDAFLAGRDTGEDRGEGAVDDRLPVASD